MRSKLPCFLATFGALSVAALSFAAPARAQSPPTGNGAPPPDLAAAIALPKGPGDAPKPNDLSSVDTTDATLSTGGQFATGNSRSFAATGSGKFNLRRGADAFDASLVGNYAEAFIVPAPVADMPAGAGAWQRSTENLQGKLRYDRFLTRDLSLFAQVTGTHDAFQAITFRLNVDPGLKYLFLNEEKVRLWGEVGYDFQFDDNYTYGDGIEQAGVGGPALDGLGLDYVISKTDTIHSSRVFAGFHYAFNKEVQVNLGLEYLQGFGGSGGGTPPLPAAPWNRPTLIDPVPISLTASRLNLDALLAAHVAGGVSIGIGFTAKYNSSPIPGKTDLDTTGTLAIIYAFSSPTPKPAAPPPCLCPPSASPPPPPPSSTSGVPPVSVAPAVTSVVAPPPAPPSSTP